MQIVLIWKARKLNHYTMMMISFRRGEGAENIILNNNILIINNSHYLSIIL
jgi:hypothetical protein